MYTIRKAATSDINYILSQLKEFSEFFGSKYSLYDEDGVTNFVTFVIKDHVFFMVEKAEKPIGFICGLVMPHIYNPKITVVYTSFFWVEEAYRKTRAAYMLISEYVKYSKQICKWVFLSIDSKTIIKDSSLNKFGFNPTGKNYLLEV